MASVLCVLLLLGNVFVFVYGACPDIIRREELSLEPLARNPVKLAVPVDNVVVRRRISYVDSRNPNSWKEAVLEIQKQDRQSRIFDNFLILEGGQVFEGRGWDEAAPLRRRNDGKSIRIAVTVNFKGRTRTPEAQKALQQLIECGVEEGKIKETYRLLDGRKKPIEDRDKSKNGADGTTTPQA